MFWALIGGMTGALAGRADYIHTVRHSVTPLATDPAVLTVPFEMARLMVPVARPWPVSPHVRPPAVISPSPGISRAVRGRGVRLQVPAAAQVQTRVLRVAQSRRSRRPPRPRAA